MTLRDRAEHRPRGLLSSVRWMVRRNRWLIALSAVAIAVSLVLLSLGVGVSDVAGSTPTIFGTVGLALFLLRLVTVTLLLTLWLPLTQRLVSRLTDSARAGEAFARSRYRVLFYYLLLESLLFFA